jgi:hypothetical protein
MGFNKYMVMWITNVGGWKYNVENVWYVKNGPRGR